jgi:hypothetical protein
MFSFVMLAFLLCQFLIGALVGALIAKDRDSWHRGIAISLALGLVVIVYFITLAIIDTQPSSHDNLPIVLRILGGVVGVLIYGFCFWIVCLIVVSAGYSSAFPIFRRLGIGPNRITLASVFAFMTILAAVAALVQLNSRPPH